MTSKTTIQRTKFPAKQKVLDTAVSHPYLIVRELCNRSFLEFFKFFWPEYSSEPLHLNWHIELLCNELQQMAERVALRLPKEHDLIINVPPGMSKTAVCSIMFPVWCWTRWHWMRFITLGYSATLSLEAAEYSRDIIRSDRFKLIYPEIDLKEDKDVKSNYRVIKKFWDKPGHVPRIEYGGNRYSTSVGGTLTGFHGHILIVDDPIDPKRAVSKTELTGTNQWLTQTLSTRKVDKLITCKITVMQRLHEDDPTGDQLKKKRHSVKHICLPGEIRNYKDKVKPAEMVKFYRGELLDPVRLDWTALEELESDLGQYGYSGQIGQNPVPPQGGMFKVDNFVSINVMPSPTNIEETVRYWDKAGTKEQADGKTKAAYTVGTKMHKLRGGKFIISDVVRGRWSADEREKIIRNVAEADGPEVKIYFEQEPGSGGKESAENTLRNLSGYHSEADRPQGDKIYRADPYSVQVNNGNVYLLQAEWNKEFIEEHRNFPFSTYKDQVDSAGGAFAKLATRRKVKVY